MAKHKFKYYLHSTKDRNSEIAYDIGVLTGHEFSAEALDKFIYAAYEVTIDAEVDTETGICHAIAVEGVPLEQPVRI